MDAAYDVALISLAEPISPEEMGLNSGIHPILPACLPHTRMRLPSRVTLASFGNDGSPEPSI